MVLGLCVVVQLEDDEAMPVGVVVRVAVLALDAVFDCVGACEGVERLLGLCVVEDEPL